MSIKAFTLGVAALLWAMPAAAQQRGTMEFGAFGSAATFDRNLSLITGYGGGGRVGMYLGRRLSIEFEDAEMHATRPNGLRDVTVGILSGRLVGVPVIAGPLSLLLGAGAGVSTETNFLHTYGLDALAGAKIGLGEHVALRADGVWDWLANENWKSYKSVHVGLSLYRSPARQPATVALVEAAPSAPPAMLQREDSVSAAETRRLRMSESSLYALRDSLNRARVRTVPPRSEAPRALQARIHFAFDKSELTDSAKGILAVQAEQIHADPTMIVVILGYADLIGTDAYNMALGSRRAESAKAYLVARGIDPSRIMIQSRGDREPVTQAPGVAGQAPNRRATFRLLIDPDVAAKP